MNELVKITEKDGHQVVSARELYKFLSSERELSTNVRAWMERNISSNMYFAENTDYQIIRYRNESNRELIDYAVTIDAAKEIIK